MWGFCDVTQRVTSSVARRYCASATRHSMAFGIRRWFRMRSFTTTSAALKTASTSPPETFQWKAWLPGASAWTCGAPLWVAFSGSVTAGQRLVVDFDGVGRVAREVTVRRHDDRDGVAGVAGDVDGDRGIGRRLRVGAGNDPGAGDRAEARVLHVPCR